MTLDEVRELKSKLQAELAELEQQEVDLENTKFKTYVDRLVALLNKIEKGSKFRISFVPEGETKRVNILVPSVYEGDLQEAAIQVVLARLERRSDKEGVNILLTKEV